ncbi:hypothetical protein E4U42_001938 [Claviceps africana]|uniref:Cytochrome P450 monooxygenase n=1 Tax=Claviceps africana TaxID=83212 RepID=A0A8K0JBM0_9HYPO|nr:hypothetical protein E4U42_001938 [Claviceps africana]
MAAEDTITPALLPLSPTTWSLLATSVFLFILYGYKKLHARALPGIPYNEKMGFFGDLPSLLRAQKAGSIRPWLIGMAKRHESPISQVFMMPFAKPCLIISDYHESYDIMVRRTKEFDRAQLHIDEFSEFTPHHHVAMRSTDPRFKANKELVRGLMSPGTLSAVFAPVVHEKAGHLIELWRTKMDAAHGRPFSAIQDLRELVMDILMASVLGHDEGRRLTQRHQGFLSSQGPSAVCADAAGIACFERPTLTPEVDALLMMPKFLDFARSSFAPHLRVWILKKTKWRKHFQRMEELLSDEINRSAKRLSIERKDSSECKTVIDHILTKEIMLAEKTQSSPNFNKPSIRDELFGFIVAGSDTVATTMSWTVKFLADNQTAQAKLRRQLRRSYGVAHDKRRQPNVSEILHIRAPYLDAFMEESLRLAKTVPGMLRQATIDTEILGHFVPKGTSIFLLAGGPSLTEPAKPTAPEARSLSSQAHSQRVPSWDDDEVTQFKPERWLKTSGNSTRTGVEEFDNVEYDPNAGPMLSFGAGSRGCFGKRLAYLEMRIMVVLLVWNFTFEKCAEHLSSYVEWDEFTCVPAYCYVKLKQAE